MIGSTLGMIIVILLAVIGVVVYQYYRLRRRYKNSISTGKKFKGMTLRKLILQMSFNRYKTGQNAIIKGFGLDSNGHRYFQTKDKNDTHLLLRPHQV